MSDKGGAQIKHKKKLMLLFLVGLMINWVMLTSLSIVGEASSLANIELLTNQRSTNNSGTTAMNPLIYNDITIEHDVIFSVTGDKLVDVEVLSGKKQVVLTIPDELRGLVVPKYNYNPSPPLPIDTEQQPEENFSATVTAHILLSEGAPVLGPVLSLVGGVVSGLVGLIDGILGGILNILLKPLLGDIRAILKTVEGLPNKLTNIGEVSYDVSIETDENGQIMSIPFEAGLGKAITVNLVKIIEELLEELRSVGGLAGAILKILSPLTNALESLLETLLNPTGETLDQLVNAAVLSNMKVDFSTTIKDPGPELYGDENGIVRTTFGMNIIQTDVIDLSILKQSTSTSQVYLQGKKSMVNETINLPDDLNFGKHEIQTLYDETFSATASGEQNEPKTTGSISLEDTTAGNKNWELRVKQLSEWSVQQQHQLTQPILRMHGSELELDKFTENDVSYSMNHSPLELRADQEVSVIKLNNTATRGSVRFDIEEFTLAIPKNTKKQAGEYKTVFTWIISNSP